MNSSLIFTLHLSKMYINAFPNTLFYIHMRTDTHTYSFNCYNWEGISVSCDKNRHTPMAVIYTLYSIIYLHFIRKYLYVLLLCRRGLRTVKRARESGGGGLRSVRSPTASVLVAASAKSHRPRSSSEWQTHESCRIILYSTEPRHRVRCSVYRQRIFYFHNYYES